MTQPAGDWRAPGAILLVSCYELGRPPLGIASPLAWLKEAGYRPDVLDLALQELDLGKVARARLAAISVPMHTALRLGVRAAERIRAANPACRVAFHGLYARLNARHLLSGVADFALGPEVEEPLLRLVQALEAGREPDLSEPRRPAAFKATDRGGLPPLKKYARLEYRGGTRLAGYVEASRGCKHLCRHCPVVPVYEGRFFAVPFETVLEGADRQIEAGASHISFADPDFLNGPAHALRVARALHERHPGLTFDFTCKIEHILKSQRLLPDFAALGCLFVTSAVESLSDVVLDHLNKGHTAADVQQALGVLRRAGIALRPSLVSFTPWTTLSDFLDVLDFVEREGLVYSVDPVHYAIRLLIPPGSLLAELPAMKPYLGELDPASFSYSWTHPDPRMDRLQAEVMRCISRAAQDGEDAALTLTKVRELALAARDGRAPRARVSPVAASGETPPRLTESWFCCAEPLGF